MSDPVTNVEIEDVLSSIRRLVSDGDKARTRDPAPEQQAVKPRDVTPQASPESTPTAGLSDKLVLTPAFLVVDGDNEGGRHKDIAPRGVDPEDDIAADNHDADSHDADDHDTDDQDADNHDDDASDESASAEGEADDDDAWLEEEWPYKIDPKPEDISDETSGVDEQTDVVDAVAAALSDDATDAPLELTEPVVKGADATVAVDDKPKPTDRSGLVATIAELEAAISAGAGDYEPDGSEMDDDETMSKTIAWPGTKVRGLDTVQDADLSDDAPQDRDSTDSAEDDTAQQEDEPAASDPGHREETEETQETEDTDVYSDDDLDGLLEVGDTTLDEEALRALVADVVREELTGPMGERITRNVRKLVRREIYRILSSQEFD